MNAARNLPSLIRTSSFGVLVALLVTSCTQDPQSPGYEYMPDMYRTKAVEAYVDYSHPDSLTARKPVEGSIPFSADYIDKPYNLNLPYPYPNTQEGLDSARENLKNPLPFTEEAYAEGEQVFTDYCTHCHGEDGKGQGPLVENGNYPPPPAYTKTPDLLTEGKIYHILKYGSLNGMMGSHASQLTREQRWKVTHYVATLRDEVKNPFKGKEQEGSAEGQERKKTVEKAAKSEADTVSTSEKQAAAQ